MYVNDLLIEQVPLQQEKAFGSVDFGPGGVGRRGVDSAIDAAYGRKWQNPIAALGTDNQHGDMRAVVVRRKRQFAHSSAMSSARSVDRRAQQLRECNRGHCGENTQDAERNLAITEGLSHVRKNILGRS